MDCSALAASSRTCIPRSPDRFHAVYGIPSGPGAEWPDILIDLVMSLRLIRQSSDEVGKFGLLWFVLGAPVRRLEWSCGVLACDVVALMWLLCELV